MNITIDLSQHTPLCEIMERHKSDKGGVDTMMSWHNYTVVYYSMFKNIRDRKKLRLFEMGIGTNNVDIPSNMGADGTPGASLRGWQEFFPTADIFGADIDSRVLFNTDRIRTIFCDQTRPDTIEHMWNTPMLQDNFDIIIDDGLHTFDANVCFFENSIHKLYPDGYFIIEDILKEYEQSFLNKIKEWKIRYSDCSFYLLNLPSTRNTLDNMLLIVYKKGFALIS